MAEQAGMGIVGFASGFIVAGGVVALMVGLGIITRFIGISHTASHVKLYENAILLGALAGTILTVFSVRLPSGLLDAALWQSASLLLLLLSGTFMGIFVGGWILALAEVINVFPVYCRRLGITKGLSWIVISMAIGKTLGSLLYFYRRW